MTEKNNTVAGFNKDPLIPATDIKFHSLSLNQPNTMGWDVQTSSEVSNDGRAYSTETVAKTDGVEELNGGGTAEFKGRNEQRSSASHQGDDRNFVKKASDSSKSHLQEKVVFGDPNSGHSEMKVSSTSTSSSFKVVSSSSTVDYDGGEPTNNTNYLTDRQHQEEIQQHQRNENQYRQQQQYEQLQQQQHQQNEQLHQQHQQQFEQLQQQQHQQHQRTQQQQLQEQRTQQQTQQQQHSTTEQFKSSKESKESNTTSNVETKQHSEKIKNYVDMDKASPEYQQHVQYLMQQPGEIISSTVEYPKPNVKMITTVKRLPDGTIVKNKRYETEEVRPTNDEVHNRSTTSSTISKRNQVQNQNQNQIRNRKQPSDEVDNVETVQHQQQGDEVTTQMFSAVKKSSSHFSKETSTETVQEYADDHLQSKNTQDFSTHGFPSVKPHKPTQEYLSERPHSQVPPTQVSQQNRSTQQYTTDHQSVKQSADDHLQSKSTQDFSTHGFPSVKPHKPTQEYLSERPHPEFPQQNRPLQNYTTDRPIPVNAELQPSGTNDEQIYVLKTENNKNVKQSSSRSVTQTEVVSDDNQSFGHRSPAHGDIPIHTQHITSRNHQTKDFSTHGFPSARDKITANTNANLDRKNTTREHIIQTKLSSENYSHPNVTPGYEQLGSPRRSLPDEDYSTHGFPSARLPSTNTTPHSASKRPTGTATKPPIRKPNAYSPTTKHMTNTESTRKLLQKEKEVDAAHRAFAASLRSSSPSESTSSRRNSNYSDQHRQTPRSSISSAKNYNTRDTREGSHDSITPSEKSHISSTTVTRSSPARSVGKTVVTKTQDHHKPRNINGSHETTTTTTKQIQPQSGNTTKTIVTTTTTKKGTAPAVKTTTTTTTIDTTQPSSEVPKSDNLYTTTTTTKSAQLTNNEQPLTKNNYNNNNMNNKNNKNNKNSTKNSNKNTKNSTKNTDPIATDSITKTKFTTNQATFSTPDKGIIEEPLCVKRNYYKLGESEKMSAFTPSSLSYPTTTNDNSNSSTNTSTTATTPNLETKNIQIPSDAIAKKDSPKQDRQSTMLQDRNDTTTNRVVAAVKNQIVAASHNENPVTSRVFASHKAPQELHVKSSPTYAPAPNTTTTTTTTTNNNSNKSTVKHIKQKSPTIEERNATRTTTNSNSNNNKNHGNVDDDDDDIDDDDETTIINSIVSDQEKQHLNQFRKVSTGSEHNSVSSVESIIEITSNAQQSPKSIDNQPSKTLKNEYSITLKPKHPKDEQLQQQHQQPLTNSIKNINSPALPSEIYNTPEPEYFLSDDDEVHTSQQHLDTHDHDNKTKIENTNNVGDESLDGSLISRDTEPDYNGKPTFRKKGLSNRETFEDRCRKILGMEDNGDTQGTFIRRSNIDIHRPDIKNEKKGTTGPIDLVEETEQIKNTFDVKIEDCIDDDDNIISELKEISKKPYAEPTVTTKTSINIDDQKIPKGSKIIDVEAPSIINDQNTQKEVDINNEKVIITETIETPQATEPKSKGVKPFLKNKTINGKPHTPTPITQNIHQKVPKKTCDNDEKLNITETTEILKTTNKIGSIDKKPLKEINKSPDESKRSSVVITQKYIKDHDDATVTVSKSTKPLRKSLTSEVRRQSGLEFNSKEEDATKKGTNEVNRKSSSPIGRKSSSPNTSAVSPLNNKVSVDRNSPSEPYNVKPKTKKTDKSVLVNKVNNESDKITNDKSYTRKLQSNTSKVSQPHKENVSQVQRNSLIEETSKGTKLTGRKSSDTSTSTIKDRLRSSSIKQKPKKDTPDSSSPHSPEPGPRRSSNISVCTEIIIDHSSPSVSIEREIDESNSDEKKRSTPVSRVSRRDSDVKANPNNPKSGHEKLQHPKVPKMSTLTPSAANTQKERTRANKCFTTKSINLTSTDILDNGGKTTSVVTDIEHAKSSREPSPDKIVPIPVPVELDTGKPRYPDAVQEPEDEPSKKPVVTIIPVFEEESNSYVGCQISEIPNEHLGKVTIDHTANDILNNPTIEAPISIEYSVNDEQPVSDYNIPNVVHELEENIDDELQINNRKVNKLPKISERPTNKQQVTHIGKVEPSYDEEPEKDASTLSVKQKVHKFINTIEKLSPTVPQKSPGLVAKIEFNNSRKFVPRKEPKTDNATSNEFIEPIQDTLMTTTVRKPSLNDKNVSSKFIDYEILNESEAVPMSKTHTTAIALKRQKDILNRPSVFSQKPIDKKPISRTIKQNGNTVENGYKTPTTPNNSVTSEYQTHICSQKTNVTATKPINESPKPETSRRRSTDYNDENHSIKHANANANVKKSSERKPKGSLSPTNTAKTTIVKTTTEHIIEHQNKPLITSCTTIKTEPALVDQPQPQTQPQQSTLSSIQNTNTTTSTTTERLTNFTDSVAARRNIFENQDTSPNSFQAQKPVEPGRRPSYMDHTKSSLEHIRRDSLEINKNNYSRKSSFEDDGSYERNQNSSVKFDVPKRSTARRDKSPSVPVDDVIEKIFDLKVLEEKLENETSYEMRRRIRSQMLYVKRKMLNSKDSTNDIYHTNGKMSPIRKQEHPKEMDNTANKIIHTKTDSKTSPVGTRKTSLGRVTPDNVHMEPLEQKTTKKPREPSPKTTTISSNLKEVRRFSGSRSVTTKQSAQIDQTENVDSAKQSYKSPIDVAPKCHPQEKPPVKPRGRSRSPSHGEPRRGSESPATKKPGGDRTPRTEKSPQRTSFVKKARSPERTIHSIPLDKSKTPTNERSKSPQSTTITSQRLESLVNSKTTHNVPKSPEQRTNKPKTDGKTSPIWADRGKLLKSTSTTTKSTEKKISSSPVPNKQRRPQTKYFEEDSVTSSYGIGPTDENGKLLFGISALKKKQHQQKTSEPYETSTVSDFIIAEKKSGSKNEHKKVFSSTNTDELIQLHKQQSNSRNSSLDHGTTTVHEYMTTIEKRPEQESTSIDTEDITSKKSVRRGSVKEISEKFIRKESTQSVTESTWKASSPKSVHILRTNSKLNTKNVSSSSSEHKSDIEIEESKASKELRTVVQSSTQQHEEFISDSDSESESVEKRHTSVSQLSGSQRTQSARSFLNSDSETRAVTSVQDCLERMRNADNVIEDNDTAEDQEARALLNKFLGASVIMHGVETIMPTKQRQQQRITSSTTNRDENNKIRSAISSDENESGVSSVKITRTLKTNKIDSSSSPSPTSKSAYDLNKIFDEEILKELLEQASTYEERRKIRARLRELMADRKEKKNWKAGEQIVTAESQSTKEEQQKVEDSSSESEYEEVIEEITDYSEEDEEPETKVKEVATSSAPNKVSNDKKLSVEKKEHSITLQKESNTKIVVAKQSVQVEESQSQTNSKVTAENAKCSKPKAAIVASKGAKNPVIDDNDDNDDIVDANTDADNNDVKGESLMPLLQDLLHKNLPQSVVNTCNSNNNSNSSSKTQITISAAGAVSNHNNNNNNNSNLDCNPNSNNSKKSSMFNVRKNNNPSVNTTLNESSNHSSFSNESNLSNQVKSQVNRLRVPQKEDSGTESGEDLRLLAAGLCDQLHMKNDTNVIAEVTSALSRLESSLREGKELSVDGNKRKALLLLVSRLQSGLTSPDKLPEVATHVSEIKAAELDENIGGIDANENNQVSSPEADVLLINRQRFAKRRNRNSRHTVGVSREELADARRYMEDMIITENILNCTTPDGNVVPPPQWFSIDKDISTGIIRTEQPNSQLSQEQSVLAHSNLVQTRTSSHLSPNGAGRNLPSGNRRPLSGDYAVSFANLQNVFSSEDDGQYPDYASSRESTKNKRFASKKHLMKRANTIDIPKAKKYNANFDTDGEAEDSRDQNLGLKRAVQVSVKQKVHSVVPPFEPKTENDHKFLAFINKQSAKSGLGWAGSRSVSNWTNKFGNIKHTFETGAAATVTTGKPPQAPGYQPQNAAKNYWHKYDVHPNVIQQKHQHDHFQMPQHLQTQHRQQPAETNEQQKSPKPYSHLNREHQLKLKRLELERQQFERYQLERESYEEQHLERERNPRDVHTVGEYQQTGQMPAPVNQFIHAPQSVFRPIQCQQAPTQPIYKPVPQKTNPGQLPPSKRPPASNLSPPYVSSPATSPVGLPWLSKPTVNNSDFRRKAHHFEERSLRDNLVEQQQSGPYLQRHGSMRASRTQQQQLEDFKKRPSLPNTNDPHLTVHAQYQPNQHYQQGQQQVPIPPPPTNMSFTYSDYNKATAPVPPPRSFNSYNYHSYPCLPTAVDYDEPQRHREDSLTNPQGQPLVLTNSNPSYSPAGASCTDTLPQSYHLNNNNLLHFNVASTVDSAPTSPSFLSAQMNNENTDDDLDSENMLEYRAETKVMRKPPSQTAVTVAGHQRSYVSDDEVIVNNPVRSLLHSMRNIGNTHNGNAQKSQTGRTTSANKRPLSKPSSPLSPLTPDGRQYQAPIVDPLFPQITNFEANRSPLYAGQEVPYKPVLNDKPNKYHQNPIYAPPPANAQHQVNKQESKNYTKYKPEVTLEPTSNATFIPSKPISVEDQKISSQNQNRTTVHPPNSLSLQRMRHQSENSNASSTKSFNNLPSPSTNFSSNTSHASDQYYQEDSIKAHPKILASPDMVPPKPQLPASKISLQKSPSQDRITLLADQEFSRPKVSTQSDVAHSHTVGVSSHSSYERNQYQFQKLPEQTHTTIPHQRPQAPMLKAQNRTQSLTQQSHITKQQTQVINQKQQLLDLRRKSLGNALDTHQQSKTTYIEQQQHKQHQHQESTQVFKSSAPADTPDIVKSSLPKDDTIVSKKFGPPQRHHYVPNAYQSPTVSSRKLTSDATAVSNVTAHHHHTVTTTMKTQTQAQCDIAQSAQTVAETENAEDLIPRHIVFNNVSAFTSMSRRNASMDEAHLDHLQHFSQKHQQSGRNRLNKCDSWHQIVAAQQQQQQTQNNKPKYPALMSSSPSSSSGGVNELRRTKSGHTLALPKMYEAGIDKAHIVEKQKTVAAYFSGKKSPSNQTSQDDVIQTHTQATISTSKKASINRIKTSNKMSTSRKSLTSSNATKTADINGEVGGFISSGLSRSATMPHLANLSLLDESNVEDAFEQLIMAQPQTQPQQRGSGSTTTKEHTETKTENDGTIVTTTTKVTTKSSTSSGTLPKRVSPFAKFQQLDKKSSLQSQGSPATPTPTTPGGAAPLFKFTDPALNARAATFKDQLLQWCQNKTQEYENVQISNFSASWSDGLAFCALIHHFLPDAFDYSKLTQKERRHNFKLAFTVADEKAGIAPLLDVDDMVEMKRPDWKCVFVYVQSIYRRFRNCQ